MLKLLHSCSHSIPSIIEDLCGENDRPLVDFRHRLLLYHNATLLMPFQKATFFELQNFYQGSGRLSNMLDRVQVLQNIVSEADISGSMVQKILFHGSLFLFKPLLLRFPLLISLLLLTNILFTLFIILVSAFLLAYRYYQHEISQTHVFVHVDFTTWFSFLVFKTKGVYCRRKILYKIQMINLMLIIQDKPPFSIFQDLSS